MKPNLANILTTATPKVGNTLFIAVDGHGGSRKSTFARWLSEQLQAELIHTDDFSGWDNPLHWWPDVITQVFEPIITGATTLSYQPASCWPDHHPELVVKQPVTPIMILEGVSASRKKFDDYISVRIFVDTPKEVCMERGIKRDMSTDSDIEKVTNMWEDWFAEEDAYFAADNPRAKADIVINGKKSFASQIVVQS